MLLYWILSVCKVLQISFLPSPSPTPAFKVEDGADGRAVKSCSSLSRPECKGDSGQGEKTQWTDFRKSQKSGSQKPCEEGNGTPLQYSGLENPMDGGAWWAAVHGVASSQKRLSDFTFTFHFHALEKEMATHSSVLAWRIPGTGEPGGLLSMGLHRVVHDWSDIEAAETLFKGKTEHFVLSMTTKWPPATLPQLEKRKTHVLLAAWSAGLSRVKGRTCCTYYVQRSEKLSVRTEQFWERICPGDVQGHGMFHWIIST